MRAVKELAPYGVAGRNLRVFKTSAEREAQLLNQILAPALRSRNPERRREAMEALENLAAVASHLKHLLLVRDLRRIAAVNLARYIRDIPDFPKPGIVFKDITPLLLDPAALDAAVQALATLAAPLSIDFVVAAEARGFILGAALARELGVGLRAGPQAREAAGGDGLGRVHPRVRRRRAGDARRRAGRRRAGAAARRPAGHGRDRGALCELVEGRGATVAGVAFLVELAFLDGRSKLAEYRRPLADRLRRE